MVVETGRYFEYVLAALILYIITIVIYELISGKSESKSKFLSGTKKPAPKIGISDVNVMSFGDSIIGFRSYKKSDRK
jgi:hypothetical protein